MTRILLFFLLTLMAAQAFPRPIVQIEGHFREIKDHPSWLILLRNIDDGSTVPWLYDFQREDNHWNVFPEGHDYQIIASELSFNSQHTVFHNFCNLEDGILSGKSLQIYLIGSLTPFTETLQCHVIHYSSG